jgi:1-phosphofructokinase
VHIDAVAVTGANGAYVHDRRSGSRVSLATIPGERLARHEADNLYEAALLAGFEAGTAVLTAQFWPIVPTDYYRRLAVDLRANGCTVIADVAGSVLQPTLEGGVDVLKVSSEELVRDEVATGEGIAELMPAIEALVAGGAKNLVVSRAAEPALVWCENRLWKLSLCVRVRRAKVTYSCRWKSCRGK